MRVVLAMCFASLAVASAAAQSAEEAVAYILHGKEATQIPGVTTRKLSSSPAVFETKSSLSVTRLTVSTADKCRFRVIEESKLAKEPEMGTTILDFDFSSAVPPVRTITYTGSGVRQLLVQVAGLKLTGCSSKMAMPGAPANSQMERQMEKIACDLIRKGTPVTDDYSAERASTALTRLKANYCKEKAS